MQGVSVCPYFRVLVFSRSHVSVFSCFHIFAFSRLVAGCGGQEQENLCNISQSVWFSDSEDQNSLTHPGVEIGQI